MTSSFEGWVHSRVCRTYSVCVTVLPVSWNFNRVFGGSGSGSLGFGHTANRRFHAS